MKCHAHFHHEKRETQVCDRICEEYFLDLVFNLGAQCVCAKSMRPIFTHTYPEEEPLSQCVFNVDTRRGSILFQEYMFVCI